MDRKYIDDHHIVARYLAERLSDADREAFEAYYVRHPDVLRELEAAASLKLGLAHLNEAGELEPLLKPQRWYRNYRYLAAAALAAIALGVGLVVVRGPSMQPLLVASSDILHTWRGVPLPIAATHRVVRTRSVAFDAELELPPSGQTLELRVLPEYEANPPLYRITLHAVADDEALKLIAEIGGLKPDADGFVRVFANTTRIEPGRYQVTLTSDQSIGDAGPASSFRIRFMAPGEGGQQY